MAYARSTMVRVLVLFCGTIVVALIHCTNDITCWAVPIAPAFAFIKCHVLVADRNGSSIGGCTRERGAIDRIVTVSLSGLGLADVNLSVLDGRRDSDAYMHSYCGNSTLLSTSHSKSITTEDGSWPSRMSLAKARTFPYSGVGFAKDRVMN